MVLQVVAGGELGDWIKDDTSGDYKEILQAMSGDRAAPIPTAEEIEEANAPPELEEVEEENLPQDPTVFAADPFDSKKDCEVCVYIHVIYQYMYAVLSVLTWAHGFYIYCVDNNHTYM